MKETSYLAENKKIISLLKKMDRFKMFSNEDISSFLKLSKLREYDAGEPVIKEGDFDCWIYFLLSGELDIVKNGKQLARLERSGDLFGEMGVIDGSPRSATIQAATKALVLAIDGSVVDRKIEENELCFCYTIYRMFAEVLAARLRDTTIQNARLQGELARLRETP